MTAAKVRRLQVLDTHTGGEPTRLLLDGGPELVGADLLAKRQCFADRYDDLRRAAVLEPRGSDVVVGAWIGPPVSPEAVASVIFFNNVGYLNMCGHGTLGVAVGLHYLGRVGLGRHWLDTPVGPVAFTLESRSRVSLENVPSYRLHRHVEVTVPNGGVLAGDVAWGGNWFFLTDQHGLDLVPGNIPALTDLGWRIRRALPAQGITGADGAEIDHIELVGRQEKGGAANFVHCPGGAYDRSPCGTGTSAKLACLAAESKLKPGERWTQTSIIGSVFEGHYRLADPAAIGADLTAVPGIVPSGVPLIIPTITGTAYVTAEATLILDPDDPFQAGLPG